MYDNRNIDVMASTDYRPVAPRLWLHVIIKEAMKETPPPRNELKSTMKIGGGSFRAGCGGMFNVK